jgi:hypothetical protein
MLRRSLFLALVALPLLAPNARAQNWDAPLFFSPRPMDDIGLYYVRTNDAFFGQDVSGIKGIWRQSGNINLGVQLGIGDLKDAGNAILVGAEFYNSIGSVSRGGSFYAAWSLGAGATIGSGYADLSIPVGVSIGPRLGTGKTNLLPYAHPRVSLDITAYDDVNGDEQTITDVGLAVDLGADLTLGDKLIVRAGYTLGGSNDVRKRNALGIGLAYRIPRKVLVR